MCPRNLTEGVGATTEGQVPQSLNLMKLMKHVLNNYGGKVEFPTYTSKIVEVIAIVEVIGETLISKLIESETDPHEHAWFSILHQFT